MSDLLSLFHAPGRSMVYAQLTLVAALMLIAILIWGLFDSRTLGGDQVWVKPAKFAASFVIHFGTLAIIIAFMSPEVAQRRIIAITGWILAAVFIFEMAYIIIQAARAQHSHFNHTTPFHSAMYSLMGLGAVVLIAMPLAIAWLAKNDVAFGPATQAGILLGAIVSFVLTLVIAGYLGNQGGHFVGHQSDPQRVLPFLGWSTEVGDLRPAHFFALHALQILPLIGLYADRIGQGIFIVWVAAIAYAALTAGLFVQALLGQPLIRL